MLLNLRQSVPTVPDFVARTTESARRDGFPVEKDPGRDSCCIPQMGYVLMMAAAAKPGGTIAEAGTAYGVGTAWLTAGLTAGATLTTVERDKEKVQSVAQLFADREDVTVLHGDSGKLLPESGPYDLLFADGLGRTADLMGETGSLLVDMLRVGGVLFFDDVRPESWDEPDRSGGLKRAFIASRDELVGTEIPLTDEWSALMATRIPV